LKNKQKPKKGESNALKRKLRKNLENSKKKIQRKERISDLFSRLYHKFFSFFQIPANFSF